MYSPTTPHLPSDDPAVRLDAGHAAADQSFDDNTIRDTAPLYARRAPLTENEIADADFRYTRMAHGVRSLDDAVATILDGLGDRDPRHARHLPVRQRVPVRRASPLRQDRCLRGIRSRADGDPLSRRCSTSAFISHTLVSNVDIAPTLGVARRIAMASRRSLAGSLAGRFRAKSVRSALLIEHCQGHNVGSVPCSGLSFYAHQTRTGGYVGVVTAREKFVRYDNGDRELFDLTSDPSELHNLVGRPGSTATAGLHGGEAGHPPSPEDPGPRS